MTSISYIRIGTYAILTLLIVLVRERHFVIPVDLADPADSDRAAAAAYEREESRDRAKRHDAIPTRKGFEQTRRSGSELMRIAEEYVAREGIDLQKFKPAVISLYERDGRLRWTLHYQSKLYPPVPGGFFALGVDDETGEVDLHPGM